MFPAMSDSITDLCRACLSPAELQHDLKGFVKIDDENVQLCDLMQLFSNLQFADERMPSRICGPCSEILQKSRQFRNVVRRSDARLKRAHDEKRPKPRTGEAKRTYTRRKRQLFSDNYLSTRPKQIRILPKLSPVYIVGPRAECKEAAIGSSVIFLPKNDGGASLPSVSHVPSGSNKIAGDAVARISLDESVECPKCSRKFVNDAFLKSHTAEAHATPERVVQCEVCEDRFDTVPQLQLHNLKVHFPAPKELCSVRELHRKDADALVRHSKKAHPERRKRRAPRTETDERAEQPATRVTCELCGRTFKNESWLSLHKDRNHVNNVCPRCNLCFSNEANLMTHSATHAVSKLYSCVLCAKDFSTRTYLTHHKKVVHKEDAELYYCGECGDGAAAYADLELLRSHLDDHSARWPAPSDATTDDAIKTETTYYTVVEGIEGEELVEISADAVEQFLNEGIKLGEYRTEISDSLTAELPTAHPSDNEIRTVSFVGKTEAVESDVGQPTQSSFPTFERLDPPTAPEADRANGGFRTHLDPSGKVHQCAECGIVMSRKYNLKRHMAMAHRLPTLDCSTCGDMFNSTAKLAAHKTIHASDAVQQPIVKNGDHFSKSPYPKTVRKQWNCQICGHKVGLWSQLYVHTRKQHGENHAGKLKAERFLCKICGKRLGTSAGFTYHMWKHAEMRPHRCSECGRRFMSRSALGKHLLTRHGNDKPHLCQHCGKGFSNKDHLKKHLMFTHGGRRDYLCGVCGRTFLQSSHAKQHMWRHTGVKPMTCRYCAAGYTTGAALKKHIIRNHPEEHRQQGIDEEQKYRLLEGTDLDEIVDMVTERTVRDMQAGARSTENVREATVDTFDSYIK